MALFLTSEQVRQASTMEGCLKSCRTAYQLLGKAQAINRPRSQLHLNVGSPGIYYLFKSMEGAIPELGVAAIRMTSQMAHWHEVDGMLRKEKQTVAKKGYLIGLIGWDSRQIEGRGNQCIGCGIFSQKRLPILGTFGDRQSCPNSNIGIYIGKAF